MKAQISRDEIKKIIKALNVQESRQTIIKLENLLRVTKGGFMLSEEKG